MLFIALTGYWFGLRAGLAAGIAFGLLRIATGAYILNPAQAVLDYVVSYGALGGFAGVFSGRRFGRSGVYIGYLAGVTGLYLAQVAAGVVFFGANAPEGQPVVVYSALYNIAHNLPEVILTIAILSLPHFKHALDKISPKNSIASASKFDLFADKYKAFRAHYAIIYVSLIALFYNAPLVHLNARTRTDATGWNIAMGTVSRPAEIISGTAPIVFVLLFVPAVLLVLFLAKASVKAMLLVSSAGFVVQCLFMVGANITLGGLVLENDYSLTIMNWILIVIYAGLVVGLRFEKEEK
jgi:thiamine transporter